MRSLKAQTAEPFAVTHIPTCFVSPGKTQETNSQSERDVPLSCYLPKHGVTTIVSLRHRSHDHQESDNTLNVGVGGKGRHFLSITTLPSQNPLGRLKKCKLADVDSDSPLFVDALGDQGMWGTQALPTVLNLPLSVIGPAEFTVNRCQDPPMQTLHKDPKLELCTTGLDCGLWVHLVAVFPPEGRPPVI
ncbi:hypothetical protein Bbelb_264850 [Branchiostoma belcheri]|nr:hypothetical protein Bbelb_264850 [Branchiostoma belcheri]